MGEPRDVPELDLEILGDDAEAQEPGVTTSAVASLVPVSGDDEDLEFDVLSATSLRDPLASLEPSLDLSELRNDAILPPALTSVPTDAEFHPPSLRVPELGARPEPPRQDSGSPLLAPRAVLPPQLSVPDLAVPARPVRAQPRSPVSVAPRSLDLDRGAAPNSAAPRSAGSRPLGAQLRTGSSLAPQSAASGPDLGYFGGNVLDDLDLDGTFGGAAPGPIGLGQGAPAELAEDGPWPTGVTPDPASLDFPREKLEALSGFPVVPGNFLLDALYFLAVRAGKKALVPKREAASQKLGKLERARDEKLGELTESFRGRLAHESRFGALYGEVNEAERALAQRKAELVGLDQGASERVRALDLRIEQAQDKARRQRLVLDDYEKAEAALERNLARSKAHANRLQIEMRNIAKVASERAPGSSEMPPSLGARYTELENDYARLSTELKGVETDVQIARAKGSEAREYYKRLEAEAGRALAEKEALLLTQEGKSGPLLAAIQLAEEALRHTRAEAGRALLRLRAEVPVDKGTRSVLAERDEAVRQALAEDEALKRAEATFDEEAFRRGRGVLWALAAAISLLLLWVVVR